MKYNQDKKAAALARIAEIGVKNTSEELGISVPTLYKWRNEGGGVSSESAQGSAMTEELRQVLINDQFLESKVKQLEDQNSALRDENRKLREKAAHMKKAIMALME